VNLPDKVLHLLWNLLPKKKEVIRGKEISYLGLPSFMIYGGGLFIRHKKTGKVMIFLSKTDPFLRYSLYHEHRESILYKRKTDEELFQMVSEGIHLANVIGRVIIDEEGIKAWIRWQRAHTVAVLDEIELAQEELTADELLAFRKNVVEKQRFGYPWMWSND
jgi:hypothetical protein